MALLGGSGYFLPIALRRKHRQKLELRLEQIRRKMGQTHHRELPDFTGTLDQITNNYQGIKRQRNCRRTGETEEQRQRGRSLRQGG